MQTLVYSEKIIQFAREIQSVIKHILSNEIGLKVIKDRFYNLKQTASYPIKSVIFNRKSTLGYFDANFYELGFNECLMYMSKDLRLNVIRHELAHYLTFINYGPVDPHGLEFKTFCEKRGWGEAVYRATVCLEDTSLASEVEENSILRKVQKLMSLATSSNKNESEQAMIKSQQLLLKHTIDSKFIGGDEEKIYLRRIMKQKRENAKMRSIARILETFFVSIVYSRGGDFTYLEILGSKVNVEIAEYVADYLNLELEKLWKQAQLSANLKGAIAKNSFYLGIAKGYCNKIHALKREYNFETSKALMVIEGKLINAQQMVYRGLRSTKSHANHCSISSSLGEQVGNRLTINTAISKSSSPLIAQITHSN